MIEVAGLTKDYGGTRAVDGLSFTVPAGAVTGFLGPNGAGKSSTMRMILGLDRPTRGTARIGGRRYRDFAAPMREVGALLDTEAVPPGMTARAHLEWLALAGGLPKGRVRASLDAVGLGAVARRKVRQLSLGMRQRLGIAAALLGDPGTLILDEPVNGLDPEGVRWIRTLMRGLAAEGRTVLVSSHLMSEMAETADRVVVIGRGRLIAETGIDELTRHGAGGRVRVAGPTPAPLAAVLGDAGFAVEWAPGGAALLVSGAEPAEVGGLAAHYGITLHELVQERPSLEDVFMDLTRDSTEHAFAATGGAPSEQRQSTAGRGPR
ncbi:ABC-2 type transport system ATP-binding protein [Murinocardiopsis flavida]|uniref:ABC-2 type transport system ATP-binding protein n=1 Tax=Murinocardiopsis flavida TaxID=645275 RepID=A0A2P8DRU2_9ACTN|nr:ATP-binding cassette domain-containing protein [Murinocardiopsis flavida]PSK99904.1 ABC-2 type transport system ATP-binding protein [Murinocardiopsis flavida]